MSKKPLAIFLIVSLLIISSSQLALAESQTNLNQPVNKNISDSIAGWQVEYTGEDAVGYCTYSDGIFRLCGDGGGTLYCPTVALYKEVKVDSDFTFSAEVNAKTLANCALVLRGSLPIAGSTHGCNFQFGHYGKGDFLLASNSSGWMPSLSYSQWTPRFFAYGNADVWYTMQLNVTASPFTVTASVFDSNGALIGKYSTNYIAGFSFSDIRYLGFVVWGFSPADYSFRNLQGPFEQPPSLSINAQSSATTAGAAVNVFGILLNQEGLPIQDRTIILSYSIAGQNAWVPIGSAQTDEQGNYLIQWINSASGTFNLKTSLINRASVCNTTTLSFLPIKDLSTFVIESNSTVNALSFDNATEVLSFNVTGPSGTTGYVRATIAKSVLTNGDQLQANIDGKPLNYTLSSFGDVWVYSFNYSHSTHQMSLQLPKDAVSTQDYGGNFLLVVIVAVLCACLLLGIVGFKRALRKPIEAVT